MTRAVQVAFPVNSLTYSKPSRRSVSSIWSLVLPRFPLTLYSELLALYINNFSLLSVLVPSPLNNDQRRRLLSYVLNSVGTTHEKWWQQNPCHLWPNSFKSFKRGQVDKSFSRLKRPCAAMLFQKSYTCQLCRWSYNILKLPSGKRPLSSSSCS